MCDSEEENCGEPAEKRRKEDSEFDCYDEAVPGTSNDHHMIVRGTSLDDEDLEDETSTEEDDSCSDDGWIDGWFKDDEEVEEDRMKDVTAIGEILGPNGYKLFVKGIPTDVHELEIQSEFERFGPVVDSCNIGNGNAFVTFLIEEDSVNAMNQMEDQIIFGQQIKVEVAKIQLWELAPELIKIIDDFLPFKDRKNFRHVCLLCPALQPKYKDQFDKLGIFKINLQNYDLRAKFVSDFDILINSRMAIDLALPTEFEMSQFTNLKPKLMELINDCHPRITKIKFCRDIPAENILTKFRNLVKIELHSSKDKDSEKLQQLINNNATGLKYLTLSGTTIKNFHFNEMPNLIEVSLACNTGLFALSLFSKAINVRKLSLEYMIINNVAAAIVATLTNLKELEVIRCHGEVSRLINQCPPSVATLLLRKITLESIITAPLVNLRCLKLERCIGEISSLLTQSAPNITKLELHFIDLETKVRRPFNNLRTAKIDSRKSMDVSQSPLLTKPGRLRLLRKKNKKVEEN